MALTKIPAYLSSTPSIVDGGNATALTIDSSENIVLTGTLSDSAGLFATQAYVTTQINSLIDSAPGALNTLNELAAAMGDDASFSTTITNSIATKLPLAGGTMTGDLILGDDVKVEIGSLSGGDLQLYHSGGNSYIKNDTSQLYVLADYFNVKNNANNKFAISTAPNDTVKLYFNNSEKLATTNTGINITGGLTADSGNFGDGDISNVGTLEVDTIAGDSDTNTNISFPGSDTITFTEGGAEAMRITSDGRVGIGTDGPEQVLHLRKASGNTSVLIESVTGGDPELHFNSEAANRSGVIRFNDNGAYAGRIQYSHTNDSMAFHRLNEGTPSLYLQGGKVGIGTASPDFPLEIAHGTPQINLYDTSSSGQFRFLLDGTTAYIQNHSTNGHLQLSTNGTGNVGIGSTPDAWYSTFDVLSIGPKNSAIFARSENNVFGTTSNAYINSSGSWAYANAGQAAMTETINGEFHWFNAVSGSADAAITFARRMSISSTGMVGIGVTPENWYTGGTLAALQVGTSTSLFNLFGTRTVLADNYYLVYSSGTDYYTTTNEASQYMQEAGAHIWKSAASGTADTAITWSEKMRINANGKIGLGSTTFAADSSSLVAIGGRLSIIENTATSLQISTGSGYAWLEAWDNSADRSPKHNLCFQPWGGRIGIGTTVPSTNLSDSTTRIGNADGLTVHLSGINWEVNGQGYTAALSNLSTSGGSHNGGLLVELASTDATDKILDLESGGVNRVRVFGNGKFSLGTGGAATNSYVQQFEVNGGMQVGNGRGDNSEHHGSYLGTPYDTGGTSPIVGMYINGHSAGNHIRHGGGTDYTSAATTHTFYTAPLTTGSYEGTRRFYIHSDGNVAVGNTGSPFDLLEVYRESSDQTKGLTITNNQNGGYGSGIIWRSKRSDAGLLNAAEITVAGENSWNSNATTSSMMQFATQKDGTLTTHLTITKNGHVGIGDTSPEFPLTIGITSATPQQVGFEITQATSGNDGRMRFKNTANSTYCRVGMDSGATFFIEPYTGSAYVKHFQMTNSGKGRSEFTIGAWINFNGQGTVAIRDSHNVSSLTDAATGDYVVYFDTDFASANHVGSVDTGMGVSVNAATYRLSASSIAAGAYRIAVRNTTNQAWVDEDYVTGMWVGPV